MHTVNGFTFESSEKTLKRLDYDLVGKNFHFVFDNGNEEMYSFLTGECLMRAGNDQVFRWEKYGCLKLDDTTFFVSFEVFGKPYRECITLVIDTENSLVTLVATQSGLLPKRKRMSFADIQFGAIKVDGKPLPIKRHSYTSDLAGKKITWTYASGFINTHIYMDMYYRIRIVSNPDDAYPAAGTSETDYVKQWLYEEPARFVKIKDSVYLCSFIEENMNKLDPIKGGNNLIILIDTKTVSDVGRLFNYNNKQQPQWGLFRAYGMWETSILTEETLPSPYRI